MLHNVVRVAATVLSKSVVPASRFQGLQSLPDHLLADIFDIVMADAVDRSLEQAWDVRPIIIAPLRRNLALVCKRFQTVVYSTSSLWSHIDDREGSFSIRRALLFSKSTSLHLTLRKQAPVRRSLAWTTYLDNINVVLDNICRWKTIEFGYEYQVKVLLHAASIRSGTTSFPTIEALDCRVMDPSSGIFQDWTFPSLKHLDIGPIVPPSGVLAGLTSLNMIFTE